MNKIKVFLQLPKVQLFRAQCRNYDITSKSILLCTMPRSGTHYMRALIANYLLAGSEMELQYVDQISASNNSVFERDLFDTKSLTGTINIPKFNAHHANKLNSIIRTHQPYHASMQDFKKIFLYREPIGFFESYLVYMYIKRGTQLTTDFIFNLIDKHFVYYERMIQTYQEIPNCLVLSFFDLSSDPLRCLDKISAYLELPSISKSKMAEIVEICSKETTQSRETAATKVNVDARPLKGSFINNGKIKCLSEEHVNYINEKVKYSNILNKAGVPVA